MAEKWKNLARQCFEGEITIPKVNLWLVGGICLFAGIAYGLLKAPMTHGVTIGSNNGNQSGCIWGMEKEDSEDAIEGQEIEE